MPYLLRLFVYHGEAEMGSSFKVMERRLLASLKRRPWSATSAALAGDERRYRGRRFPCSSRRAIDRLNLRGNDISETSRRELPRAHYLRP